MNNETTNTTSQVKGLVQAALFAALIILRSEERRVGKEC